MTGSTPSPAPEVVPGEVSIRKQERAGRITLTRPKALNALTWSMVHAITDALTAWRDDDDIALVIIDAEGEKAFCAGGDITALYYQGRAGNEADGQQFWRDEYRLNAMIAGYDKPVVVFMQGFTMGGGVGLGCHASHRVVCESTRVALPECGIGLVPDVGATALLARAPGRSGEYLGLTGDRMNAGDAIYTGFADTMVPLGAWPAVIEALCATGNTAMIKAASLPAPQSKLAAWQEHIDRGFNVPDLDTIRRESKAVPPAPIAHALDLMEKSSPISMACTLQIIRDVRRDPTIENALRHEYRYTHRAIRQTDFLEGVRAAVIDRDRNPRWRHTDWSVPADVVDTLLAPLGDDELNLKDKS